MIRVEREYVFVDTFGQDTSQNLHKLDHQLWLCEMQKVRLIRASIQGNYVRTVRHGNHVRINSFRRFS